MDTTRIIARHLVNRKYEDLPEQTVHHTKLGILDTIGCILAASTLGEGCRELIDLIKEGGGKEESTIIGFWEKVPSWMAAFANGAMSHPIDYDDIHDLAHVHPLACTFPSALAIAERIGGVSGKSFITAVALANDLTIRLGLCPEKDGGHYGWMQPPLLGFFGAAASAGKILGLNEDQMVSALSFAFYQASSSRKQTTSGSIFRSIRDGFTGKAGILSALMAGKNMIGGEDVLDGKYGFFDTFYRGEYNPKPLTADLGDCYEVGRFKPWPINGRAQAPVDGALYLMREHAIRVGNIKDVLLTVKPDEVVPDEKLKEKCNPKTAIDAKLSTSFCVAVALSRGKVDLSGFNEKSLNDPTIIRTAQKIRYAANPDFAGKGQRAVTVMIEMNNGEKYSIQIDRPYGHAMNPMTEKDLIEKFKHCEKYSTKPLGERIVEDFISIVINLEQSADINSVIRFVAS